MPCRFVYKSLALFHTGLMARLLIATRSSMLSLGRPLEDICLFFHVAAYRKTTRQRLEARPVAQLAARDRLDLARRTRDAPRTRLASLASIGRGRRVLVSTEGVRQRLFKYRALGPRHGFFILL